YRSGGDSAVRVRSLTKTYRAGSGDPVLANDRIDLDVPAGQVFGLLGQNGAGKTTLVMQLLGLVVPSSGCILIHGRDVLASPEWAKESAGFLPQTPLAMDLINTRRALHYTGRLRGSSERDARHQAAELIEELQLDECADRYVHQLSGGMRRMVNLGMAMMSRPRLIVLDEPTNELDPQRRRLVWQVLERHNHQHGSTVLLVTHNVLEAESTVHQVAVMRDGRIVACGTPGELKQRLGLGPRVEITVRGGAELTSDELSRLSAWGEVSADGRAGRYVVTTGADRLPLVVRALTVEVGLGRNDDFRVARPSLEEVYLSIDRGLDVAARSPRPSPPSAGTRTTGADPRRLVHDAVPPLGRPAAPVAQTTARRAVAPVTARRAVAASSRPVRMAVAFKYLWFEQLLQIRSIWLWSTVVGVLMPTAMVFGLPRIGRSGVDSTSLSTIVSGSAVFSLTSQSFVALAMMIGVLKADGRMLYYASLPISKVSFVAAIVLTRLLLVFPGLVAPLLAANWFYDARLTLSPALLLIFPLAGLSLAAMGLAVGSVLRRVEAIAVVTNVVVFVLLLASPVLINPASLPGPVRMFGYALPTTYAADAVRRSIVGDLGPVFGTDLAVLALAATVGLLIAGRYIRWRVN
ncbi:MAG: type transport system permease protein, partial [Micromonosporaceae bacterium]|nr:type transport system permease protein [Micromonosporaceae bacterium]